MADFRRLQPGDDFAPAAAEWNTLLDAGEWYQRQQQGVIAPATGAALGPGEVLVRNDSGEARSRWDVLGLDGFVLDPESGVDAWAETPTFKGVTPTIADHDAKFAVLLEPAAPDAVVRGKVSGLCPVKVEFQEGEEWYEFADVKDNACVALVGLPAGRAHILGKQTVGSDTYAWVDLGQPSGSVIEDCVFTGGLDGGTFGEATVRGGDYTITAVAPPFFTEDQTSIAPGSLGAVRWHRWLRQWIAIAASCAG